MSLSLLSLTVLSFFVSLSLSIQIPVDASLAGKCSTPDPSDNFTRPAYDGVWFEIAKYQTKGGGFFEKDCVCTYINVTESGDGKYLVDNVCRDKTPDGEETTAVGELFNENPPGAFEERFCPVCPAVSYTIVLIDAQGKNFSVEYDCGISFNTVQYCVHILSRTPTMDEGTFNWILSEVNKMGLNQFNLPLQYTKQEGCW
eukprot:TRINITY_DN498_c0_g1_i2.p1 TRINITY_DN498_c0_g1~~TRINITY_DN498_c0_g1_i2.p1  ORF type:complete len:214 (-),score=63.58 TRINITY_DN498_c0_g1_i2:71-670(-)